MKERYFHSKILIQLQTISWYLFLGCFLLASVLYLLELPMAGKVAVWGVMVILAMTIIKIIILAEQFRVARLYRFWMLSYILLFILASTVLLRRIFIE